MLNFFFVFSFFNFVLSYNSVLDIDELSSVYYDIDILKEPVLKKNDWDEEILRVVNKFGQEYICNVPEIEAVKNENKKEENLDELVDIASLLKPMESAPCLSKRKDWWTYEFCYGSLIKQYHMEDNKVTGPILFLGKYESEYNWKNSTESKNKLEKYHSQYYVNGTRCDITGEPRRTEVRFHCEEGAGDYIKLVDEPQSCKYVVVIATTRLCHHPYLKPQSNKTPYGISCVPALTEDQYEKYQRIEEIKEERKAASSMQKGALAAHPEVEGPEGATLPTENETEEDEAKFSIRLLTIPLSSRKNAKRKGHHEGETRGKLSGESSSEDVLGLFGDAEEVSAETDPEDGLDEEELKHLMDRIRSGVQKTPTKGHQALHDPQNLKQETDTENTDPTGMTNEAPDKPRESYPEDVFEVTSKNLKDRASYTKAVGPKMRRKVHELLHKWQATQNKREFEEVGDEGKKNFMKEMLSDFEDTFAESPEFVKDVMNIAEKHSKELIPNNDLDSIMKSQTKLKELMSELSKSLGEASNADSKVDDDAHESLLKAYNEMQKLFEDNPEFIQDVLKLSVRYSDEFIDDDENSLADALKDHSKLEKVVRTLDTAVQATKEKANKMREKIRTLESLIDREVEAMTSWQREQGVESSQDDEGKEVTKVLKDGEESQIHQLDSLTERILEHSHKMKLEQKIKERLQKSGLDNIGSKIEVKILSPTLDEEDKDAPMTLSPEETEAIHSMIFNVLEATAEELKERERHQNLLDNYSFSMDESLLSGPHGGEEAAPGQGEGAAGDPDPLPEEDTSQDEREEDSLDYLFGR